MHQMRLCPGFLFINEPISTRISINDMMMHLNKNMPIDVFDETSSFSN